MSDAENMEKLRNIDALMTSIETNTEVPSEPEKPETPKVQEAEEKPEDNTVEGEGEVQDKEPAENAGNAEKPDSKEQEKQKTESESDVDEYGNPVTKKQKMYTEEEVQQKIRDRLKRGAFRDSGQEPTAGQQQQAKDAGFEYNENSDESWDVQLKKFIKNTINEDRQEALAKQQQERSRAAMVEFESKFERDMARYPDFVETLSEHNITNDMTMSLQGLDNPAAFIYAAAKREPGELKRIAALESPYQQVLEMGRLHERLKKPRVTSKKPDPVSPDRSDISDKTPPKYSVDHLIQEDALKRYRR